MKKGKQFPEPSFTITYRVTRKLAGLVFRHAFKGRYYSLEDLSVYQGLESVIYTPNHISNLDPPFVHAGIPKPIVYSMLAKYIFDMPVIRWLMPKLGIFPVDRERVGTAALRYSEDVLRKGYPLLLFPEGRHSTAPDKGIDKLEGGAALLATKTGAAIVPVYVHGFGANGYDGPPIIVFGRPFYPDEVPFVEGQKLRDAVTARIRTDWEYMRDCAVPGLMNP